MFRPVENWYVCKVLFFFDFTYQEGAPGSNFVFGELMKNHDVSPYSKAIPRVKPYDEAEQKKKLWSLMLRIFRLLSDW